MIEIVIDHSYEDDYFIISEIVVDIKDDTEKERIESIAEEHLNGVFVDVDNRLTKRLAKLLEVDEELINLDTNEIDLM